MAEHDSGVRRSSRIKEKDATIPPNTHVDTAVSKVSATRPKMRPQIPESRIRNQGPLVSIDAHHLPPQVHPSVYIPAMSSGVEAGFDTIVRFKETRLNQLILSQATSKPLDVAFDGISTSIVREVLSVLRPETSARHRNDHLSFLIQDDTAKPFLYALNRWDKAATCLMRNIEVEDRKSVSHESALADASELPHTVFLMPVDAADVVGVLKSLTALQAGAEMAEYITKLAASVNTIHQASDLSDKEKLLWISAIRLFLISVAIMLGRWTYPSLGVFLSKNTLNTTMALALGEHTRVGNRIDHGLLNAAVENGQCGWARVFNENAQSIFNEIVNNPIFYIGFGEVQYTGV